MDVNEALLWARLSGTKKRFERARQRVEKHLVEHGGYVAWSGGKDSSVCALLATSVDPSVPLVHYDSGLEFPEVIEYQDRIADEHGWRFDRIQTGDALRVMVDGGTWEHGNDRTHDAEAWFDAAIAGPAKEARGRYGDGMIWGLRAEESKARAGLLSRTRDGYTRPDGVRVCSPVWDWYGKDVYAFLAVHGVPLCPVYQRFAELGIPVEAWRVSLVVDAGGARRGRFVWLKRGWPDLWRRLVVDLPRLREYS